MFLLSKALMWKPRGSGASAPDGLVLEYFQAHCQAEATSEMATKLPLEEQVKGEDLIGELLKSLFGTRKTAHNWEKKAADELSSKVALSMVHGRQLSCVVESVCYVGLRTVMTS